MLLGWLANTRDVLIVLWALLSVLALLFIILAAWAIYRNARALVRTTQNTVNSDIRPILSLGQDTVNNVAGTARFMSQTTTTPVIRLLSLLTGVLRALSVFLGLRGAGGGRG
jgi:K+ transporter